MKNPAAARPMAMSKAERMGKMCWEITNWGI
jgi:hypothetical protein